VASHRKAFSKKGLHRKREGMEGKNKKSFWYPTQKITPGLMHQIPRAGTGDSVGQFHHYRWSSLINYDSNILMCGTFLIQVIPHTNNRELQKRPTIWIWVQSLWTFGHFVPQQRFFVPKNCTILVCFHPLGRGVPLRNVVGLAVTAQDARNRTLVVHERSDSLLFSIAM